MPDKSDRAYRWLRLFRGQESELGQLRHWLTGLLPDSPGRDDLISVAVELGTNAVQHTASGNSGWFTVEVASLGPMLRVSVTDEGAERGPSLADDSPATMDFDFAADSDSLDEDDVLDAIAGTRCDRGRGLLIVRALAVTCGVCGNASGRTVWAEVAQAPAPTETPTQAETRIPAHTPARIHTRTPSLSLAGPPGTPRTTNGQGRSSRPARQLGVITGVLPSATLLSPAGPWSVRQRRGGMPTDHGGTL